MAESLSEKLDRIVAAVITDRVPPLADAEISDLARVAIALRNLPREEFKQLLKAELERSVAPTTQPEPTAATKPGRESLHTLTPYLAVREANELIEFVKSAFGAEGVIHGIGSEGGIHAEYTIGDSIVMIGGGASWRGDPMPTGLHLYVEDVDAVYQRALAAGAESLYPPMDQEYGDREAGVEDLAGNQWFIATHKEGHYIPEGLRNITPFLHPRGAAEMIDFLKPAFGAVEISRTQSPDGVIRHASIAIGDSVVEMGEAHGRWQPKPTMMFLNVDDVDSWYARAVAAGATPKSEPADQPYGDRVGAVADPGGNIWYLATHIAEAPMSEPSPVSDEPSGRALATVTPYLSVNEAVELIEFTRQAFGAEELLRTTGSAGGIHSEVKIGGSIVMIGGGPKKTTPSMPTALHLYVSDADAVYRRALDAGAVSIQEPFDEPYLGDRLGAVRDLAGNQWYIATNKATGGAPEGLPNVMTYLHPPGAARMIDFLQSAFGAEDVYRAQTPDGIVHHAKVRIGNSIVELGDPHAEYQPMPTMFYLSVDDTDASYARAVAGGAIPMSEPADQAYGDRVGSVADSFGNIWYLASPVKAHPAESSNATSEDEKMPQRRETMANVPKLFRVMLEVADLERAVAFYSKLLNIQGRILRGSRAYFDCGPVILALLDPTAGGMKPKPNPTDLYFAVENLEEVYERARELKCLSKEEVHGESAGEIVKRPWGERSFYAVDAWGNGLCFVDEKTLYTG